MRFSISAAIKCSETVIHALLRKSEIITAKFHYGLLKYSVLDQILSSL